MTNELTTTDFQQLDKLDENQIIAELQGAVAQDMVYSFRSGGKQVTGLSWSGVKHLAARLGNIQIDLLQVLDTQESWVVLCKAQIGESSRIGASEQPKITSKGKPDGFALPKATSKAQRNAIRALLPEKLIVETIQAHAAIPGQARPAPAQPSQSQPVTPKPANGNGKRSPKAKFANQMVAELNVPVEEIGEAVRLYGGFDEAKLTTLEVWVRFIVTLSHDLTAPLEEVAMALHGGYDEFDPEHYQEQYNYVVNCLRDDHDHGPDHHDHGPDHHGQDEISF